MPIDASQIDAEPPDQGAAVDAGLVDVGFDAGASDADSPPAASGTLHIHTARKLFELDLATVTTTELGSFQGPGGARIPNVVDIATTLDGRMVAGAREGDLYLLDPVTAELTNPRALGDIAQGLANLPDGRVRVAGDRLSAVDPLTRSVDEVLHDEQGLGISGDAVVLASRTVLWTVRPRPVDQSGDGWLWTHPAAPIQRTDTSPAYCIDGLAEVHAECVRGALGVRCEASPSLYGGAAPSPRRPTLEASAWDLRR